MAAGIDNLEENRCEEGEGLPMRGNAKGRRCEGMRRVVGAKECEGSPMRGRWRVAGVRRVETIDEAMARWVGGDAVGMARRIGVADGKTRARATMRWGDGKMVWHFFVREWELGEWGKWNKTKCGWIWFLV